MSEAVELASKESYFLVSFEYAGGLGEVFYTDWTSDVVFAGKIYLSTPDMEIDLPTNDGMFGEQVCNVSIPLDPDPDHFTQRISAGLAHAPVTVTVREITRSTTPGPSQNVDKPFIGQIERSIRNTRGRVDKIKLQCLPVKARLADIALGVPTEVTCGNDLGDALCKVDLSDDNRTVSVVITTIDGQEVIISTNATVEGKPDRFFHRGFMQFEGLSITIRDWVDANPLTFELVEQPPDHWLGETVTLVAGCDHSIATCRTRFLPPGGAPVGTQGNESNFNGRGFAMPTYHPNFEEGPR